MPNLSSTQRSQLTNSSWREGKASESFCSQSLEVADVVVLTTVHGVDSQEIVQYCSQRSPVQELNIHTVTHFSTHGCTLRKAVLQLSLTSLTAAAA